MKTHVAIGAGILIAMICGFAAISAQTRPPASSDERARIAAGKRLFAETCQNDHCHGGSARNMEDLSGLTAEHVRRVINEGVPDAGMQSFKDVFTPEQVEQLVAYVLSVSKDPAESKARSSSRLVPAHTTKTRDGRSGEMADCLARAFAATPTRGAYGVAR